MRFKSILFYLFIFCNGTDFSQRLIFEEIPEKILEPPKYGMKGIHYVHFFYETGLMTGSAGTDTFKVNQLKSSFVASGLRYKLKLSKRVAFIGDVFYRLKSFYIKQKNNTFPDTLEYKKEKFNFNQGGAGLALRYIYGRRKKYFGRHFDLGVTAAWNFSTARFTKVEIKEEGQFSEKKVIRVRDKNLSFANPFDLTAFVTWGLEKFQFKLQYGFTDYFSAYKTKKVPEFPKLMLGFNIAITGS
jgi:hypothetical protein